MKPPIFEYTRAASVEEVLDILAVDPDAKILAGGQSLVPLLNLRLARPSILVDINRLPGLDYVEPGPDGLRIGALVRHSRLAGGRDVWEHVPLLAQAARHIGHVAIRNRGTCGGSIAHADPTAELPTATVALGASFRLRSRQGDRVVPAETFFVSVYTTALRDDEMLVEVIIPPRPCGEGTAFLELTMREGDFAIVAVAAVTRVQDGCLRGPRIVWSGADVRPVVAGELSRSLEGVRLEGADVERLAADAVQALAPPPDVRGSTEYRRHALRVLTARALRAAAHRAAAHSAEGEA
jgi:carbon-monoxide dehydrogenase medium subunit